MPRRSTTGPASISAVISAARSAGSNNFNGLVLSDYSARLLGGVQAGADCQFAPNWVVGVEGQYSWLGNNKLNAAFPGGLLYTNDQRALGFDHRPRRLHLGSGPASTSKAATPIPTTATP